MPEATLTPVTEPNVYINRELSLLDFNRRVLEQAKDPGTPLLERLRFLTICSQNLDEFFEIRVAGLKQQVAHGVVDVGRDGLSPRETLRRVSETAHALVREQYRVLNEVLLPSLEGAGIRIARREEWSPRQEKWIKRAFATDVLPVLTPMGLDPSHPFPRILNKSLNFIVSVEGTDAFGRSGDIAVVQVPRSLPRIIALPKEVTRNPTDFVLLSSIVHAHVDALFPGMKVTGCHQFRVTRNSDLWVEEEEVDDLLHAIRGELGSRKYGEAVRLEVADTCSKDVSQLLLGKFRLEPDDLYPVDGPVNLNRLAALYDLVDRADIKYPPLRPRVPRRVTREQSMFDVLRHGDLLLHHPFESVTPVLDLVREAATDPNVLAIKQTLYRTGAESPFARALVDAARAGKEVTAVVELRARFDEEANINLATKLQEAGAIVVYGVVGYKAHAKMLLVVRREGRRLRRYVHLGTGNYHLRTARQYTDFSLLSCERGLGEDVHALFMQLTGLGKEPRLKKILQSPFTLQRTLVSLIEGEAANARAGKPARIIAKMNSLSETRIMSALQEASRAGVQVNLIVRGICCLRPGVPGHSDNIRVRSIIGRFLEHSRIFYFLAGGENVTYCSSADWMDRNFYTRVETCFPIEDPRLRQRVFEEGLEAYLADGSAWILQADGTYRRSRPGRDKGRAAQDVLLETLTGQAPPAEV